MTPSFLSNIRRFCAHIDTSIKETRSKPVRLWRTFKFWNITNDIFIKSTVYVSYIVPSTEPRFFSGEGWGALIWKGRRFQILSLRRGANSKGGACLKLGTNSSINGKYYWLIGHFCCCWCCVFNLIFVLFLFLFISHYVKKRVSMDRVQNFSTKIKKCPWTRSMTGRPWTRSMKVVNGPSPKWGSVFIDYKRGSSFHAGFWNNQTGGYIYHHSFQKTIYQRQRENICGSTDFNFKITHHNRDFEHGRISTLQ